MASSQTLNRKLYRRTTNGQTFADRLVFHEEPLETTLPTPTSVLIKVHAVSLNYRDANIINGTNPWPTRSDGIPSSDAAGEVLSVGPAVTRFKIGDRVAPIVDQKSINGQEQEREWLGGEVDGVLATHLVFDQERVVKIPDHLSWAEAACLPNAGLTAWSSLATGGKLIAGMTVLIQGAFYYPIRLKSDAHDKIAGTGGVSMMAVKLARTAGCKVILTSSSDEKLERIQSIAGVSPISAINYNKTPNWDEEAVRLNNGQGVDIVLENGGTPSLLRSIRAAAMGGIVSQVGYLGKQDSADLDGLLSPIIDKRVILRGINVGSRLDFELLNKLIQANATTFEEVIDRKYAFDQAAEAIEYLWSGKHVGKIIVEI